MGLPDTSTMEYGRGSALPGQLMGDGSTKPYQGYTPEYTPPSRTDPTSTMPTAPQSNYKVQTGEGEYLDGQMRPGGSKNYKGIPPLVSQPMMPYGTPYPLASY